MLRPTRNLLAMRPLPVVVFALLTGIAPAAFAQSGTQGSEQSLAETLQGPASDAYGSARVLLNNKDYAGALAKYRQAYELSHDARLLFDMAICNRSLRAYARMQSLLQQYEREAGAGISQQDRVQVDDALAAIQNLVGTVTLTVSEPDATVTLDGEPVGTTPLGQRIVIDLGTHKIGVTKPGFVALERAVDVGGGSQTELSLTLAPVILEAHLLVTSDSDATVSIDGQVVGKGRFDGPLAPGIHGVGVTEVDRLPYGAQNRATGRRDADDASDARARASREPAALVAGGRCRSCGGGGRGILLVQVVRLRAGPRSREVRDRDLSVRV